MWANGKSSVPFGVCVLGEKNARISKLALIRLVTLKDGSPEDKKEEKTETKRQIDVGTTVQRAYKTSPKYSWKSRSSKSASIPEWKCIKVSHGKWNRDFGRMLPSGEGDGVRASVRVRGGRVGLGVRVNVGVTDSCNFYAPLTRAT
jgi:hypothetical protein